MRSIRVTSHTGKSLSYTLALWQACQMRRPDKSEQLFIALVLLVVPFAYFAIRTVLGLLGV